MSDDKKTLKETIKQHQERQTETRKPQNWEDIHNDEWKIRHIMEDVLGWECFGSWESYLKKYGVQEYGLGAGISYSTPTPVAFYAYTEWRVFSADHEDLKPFDPLHNMADAWTVLQKMVPLPDELAILTSWTPEQICRAAYEAVQQFHAQVKRVPVEPDER